MKSRMSSRDYLNKYFPENRVVESFYNKLVRKRFSESRKLKHLYCLKKLFSLHDLTKIGPQELTEILEWIESTNYAPESKRDLRITLKRFLEHVGKKDLTDFRTSVKSRERKRLPEILSDEEIEKLIKHAGSIRDKAMIALAAESGPRIEELLSMRIENVVFDDFGCYVIYPTGKTGPRKNRIFGLFNNIALLKAWLDQHPFRSNPSAPLWVMRRKGHNEWVPLDYDTARTLIRKIAERAKMKKRVYWHIFRHTACTRAASFMTERQMEVYFGWIPGSKMPRIYVHLSGKDVEDSLMKHYGIKKEEDKKLIKCSRCGKYNPPSVDYCYNCFAALKPELVRRIEELEQELEERSDAAIKLKEKILEERIKKLEKQMAELLNRL